jgi:hypothetical protein
MFNTSSSKEELLRRLTKTIFVLMKDHSDSKANFVVEVLKYLVTTNLNDSSVIMFFKMCQIKEFDEARIKIESIFYS